MNLKLHKLGLVPFPQNIQWAQHSLLQPTPILLDDDTIRVYCGMRDAKGQSRVGFVDLDARDPRKILKVSEKPALELGQDGMFDESGVVPCAIIRRDGKFQLYYAGYQLGQRIRFYVFSGMAMSDDGENFTRQQRTPVLERSDSEPLFRVIHSILPDGGKWHAWYGAGDTFREGEHKTLPVYNVRHLESEDSEHFPEAGRVVIDIQGDEHRIGRPYVVRCKDGYVMFYGYGSEQEPYNLGMAVSDNGFTWTRCDEMVRFDAPDEPWEKEMKAYPAAINTRHGAYFFYNGNAYGKDGFGCCKIEGLFE